jgi:DNA-binding NarL/FixJ family response regulator
MAGPPTPGGDAMSASQKIRVLSVDDHALFRSGIAAVLAQEPDMEAIAEATNGREAIEQYRAHLPDVVLMDLQMPVMSGVDAMVEIRREYPDARFLVLTTYRGDAQALRALKAGALGYLLKSSLREDLANAIRAVHKGRQHIPRDIADEIVQHVTDDALSPREIEILQQVAQGSSNKIIAGRLSISEGTVKTHLKNILSKLGANDRTHAVTIATKRGFLES